MATADVAEEAECLAEIFGDAFLKISDREWVVTVIPGCQLAIFLPPTYPRDAPPTIAVQADVVTDATSLELSAAAVTAYAEADGDVCCFQIIEHAKEVLGDLVATHEHLVESAAAAVIAGSSCDDTTGTGSGEIDNDTVAAGKGTEEHWTFEPDSTRFKQPRRTFEVVDSDAGMPEIVHGDVFEDRKSRFQAHVAKVTTQREVDWVYQTLLQDKKIGRASHNVVYHRYRDPLTQIDCHDNDDDGETGAGSRLAEMMHLMGVTDVFVMVSRWYGGTQLGPDRFKHFNNCARTLLETAGMVPPSSSGGGTKKGRSKGK